VNKSITQEEFDSLPDATPRFGVEERVIDGRVVRVPYLEAGPGVGVVLWTEPDEPCMVQDAHGDYWRVGWHEGVRYKVRMYA
jgi:hypothetical protein